MTERHEGLSASVQERPTMEPFRVPREGDLPPSHLSVLDTFRAPVEWLFRRIWKVTVHHPERLPLRRALVAVNHVGALDGPFAVAMVPHSQALTKAELWNHRVVGKFLDQVGQIPIDRWNADPDGLARCIQSLEADRHVVIFPEGHRGPENYERFKGGVAYLALVTGAPVVPVALVGTSTGGTGIGSIPRPGSEVHVVYGEPVVVEPKEWPRTAREVADLTQRLRSICAQHVQQAHEDLGLELP